MYGGSRAVQLDSFPRPTPIVALTGATSITGVRRILRRVHNSPLGGSPAVLLGLVLWNSGNYAFFLLAGRWIGPDDYGIVAALLSITLIVLVPSGALQVAMSRHTAEFGHTEPERSAALFHHALRRTIVVGCLVAGLAFVATALVAPAFPRTAVLLTSLAIVPMGAFSLALGRLQGQHRFGAFASGLTMLGAPRPVAFALLSFTTAGVVAAMGATVLAMASAAAVVLALAWPREGTTSAVGVREWVVFRRELTPLAVGLAGVAVLLNLDVIVARAGLSQREAGHFGAVAVLAKAVTLVPQTISWVLLPRIARSHADARPTGSFLALGVAISALAGGLITLACLAVGTPIVELAFGSDYSNGGRLLAPLVAAGGLTGLLMILMNHQMGRGANRFTWVVAGLAVLEIVLFLVWHGSATAIVLVEVAVAIVGIAVYELLYGSTDDGLRRSVGDLFLNGASWRLSTK